MRLRGRIDHPIHNGERADCQIQVPTRLENPVVGNQTISERLDRVGAHLEEAVYQRRASSGNVRRGLFPGLKEICRLTLRNRSVTQCVT